MRATRPLNPPWLLSPTPLRATEYYPWVSEDAKLQVLSRTWHFGGRQSKSPQDVHCETNTTVFLTLCWLFDWRPPKCQFLDKTLSFEGRTLTEVVVICCCFVNRISNSYLSLNTFFIFIIIDNHLMLIKHQKSLSFGT